MRVKLRNKNVPIFVFIGVNYWLTRSTRIYVDREGECQRWRSGMYLGWEFSGHAASIKSRSRKVKTYYVMLNVAGVGGWCSSVWLCLPSVWTLKNLVFYSSLILKSDQLFFPYFLSRRSQIGRKISFNFIFYDKFHQHFTVRKGAFFFILKKISAPTVSGEWSP